MALTKIESVHEPVEDVVEALEDLLELAKSGELRSIVVAMQLSGYRSGSRFSVANHSDWLAMVGELEVAKRSMLDWIEEDRYED